MVTKNRRLTKASVYRYWQKRFQLDLSQQLKDELGLVQAGSKEALDIALRRSYEETVNWVTNQALYHQVRAIVKTLCNQYEIPTRAQGLLMAFGEKVLANFFIDRKGETLPNLVWDYTRKLLEYTRPAQGGQIVGFFHYDGKDISVPELLRKIVVEVAKLVGVTPQQAGGYLSGSHLHVI